MIDYTKLRIGDKVTIEGEIIELTAAGLRINVPTTRTNDKDLYINFERIKTYTPAPRPIEVGCKVRTINNEGVVISLNGIRAWVQWTNGGDAIVWLDSLTRID